VSNLYEERDDLGDKAYSGPNAYDDAADFTFPAYDGSVQDTAPLSFSGVLSQSNLSGENSAKNPYGQYGGVLSQEGLAS
jgi:hypothetical protein